MDRLNRLTTGRKVMLGLAGGVCLGLLIGCVGLVTVNQLNSRLGAVVDEQSPRPMPSPP